MAARLLNGPDGWGVPARLFHWTLAALPGHMATIEKRLARLGHAGLHVMMFAIPLTGWLMASASPLQDTFGVQNKVFDWFMLPDPLVPGTEALRDVFHLMHLGCTIVLIALILSHVGASRFCRNLRPYLSVRVHFW